ncbi:glycine zipper 2TM domain-containing protein [Duganella lactea]|nr:glycine zipper 2TM domain-containing protein [Duganella lactea]
MDTQNTKPGTHPIMIIAAVAVVLFCGVGAAAMLGWLPTSNANVPDKMAGMPPPQSQQMGYADNGAPRAAQNTAPAVSQGRGQAQEQESRNAPCSNCGVVESVRQIEHRPEGSGVGAVGGAVLGGLLGNQVGGGHGRQLATVAGAVGGAVAGNQIEGSMKTTYSWNIVVRMDNGTKRTIHSSSAPQWRNGDAVRVVNGQLRSLD